MSVTEVHKTGQAKKAYWSVLRWKTKNKTILTNKKGTCIVPF